MLKQLASGGGLAFEARTMRERLDVGRLDSRTSGSPVPPVSLGSPAGGGRPANVLALGFLDRLRLSG